jgi:hypothetical protein
VTGMSDFGGGLWKTCPDCSELKAITEFGRNRSRADGLAAYCKVCFQARANAHYRRKQAALGREVRERVEIEGMRRCARCGEIKAIGDFHRAASKASGLNCYCKTCRSEYGSENHLRRSYGLDRGAVRRLVAEQQGLCALCEDRAAAHVDHDHVTGAVRRVLCSRCNLALGHFSDDIDLLERAIHYLRDTTWQRTQVAAGVYQLTSPRGWTPRAAVA